jgi:S1-C subfamily serine protease
VWSLIGALAGWLRATAVAAAVMEILILPVAAQPSPEILATAAPAIVRIVASLCSDGEPRTGSGFVWNATDQVVTALHVVAGCRAVQVYYQTGYENRVKNAVVTRFLRTADLALLNVRDALDVSPLLESVRVPVGETVVVYGYGLGVSTREERPLYVTSANEQAPYLSDAINTEAQQQLRALGAPSLDTEVLRVDGNLLPGHSGAPIIDRAGRVIGIGSGGLQRGAVGVGWAIRARYLADLVRAPFASSNGPPSLGTAFGASYATVSADSQGRHVRCGELEFVQTRTRLPLGTLVASSDDQTGFRQIAATTGRSWDVLSAMQFDIWTESRSGAGIAVPTGRVLQRRNGSCIVDWSNGDVELFVAGMTLPYADSPAWPSEVQRTTSQIEVLWAQEFLPYLTIDPRFSYGQPRPGPGGFWVNRTTYMGQRPGNHFHAALETLLAKGTASIGVAAITRHYPMPYDTPTEQVFLEWVASVLAAHLSTIPP